MTDAERYLRGEAAESPELSADIQERFAEQKRTLLACRISGAGRVARGAAAAVMAAGAFYCFVMLAFGGFLVDISGMTRYIAPYFVLFGAGLVFLSAGAFQSIYELRKGLRAPRRMQKVNFAARYGSAFLFGAFLPAIFLPRAAVATTPLVVFATAVVMFPYWSTFTALTVRRLALWYREDIILEQKRTQLAVALLQERLAESLPTMRGAAGPEGGAPR